MSATVDIDETTPFDYVAERAEAFTRLLAKIQTVDDPELRNCGLRMLEAVVGSLVEERAGEVVNLVRVK